MVETQNYTGVLYIEECCNCGMTFGMSQDFRDGCLDDGKSFYCPKGHSQFYKKSKIKLLEEKLAVSNRREEYLKNDLKYTQNKLRGEKGAKTKLKNRIKNGICPCCNRSFTNLKRHMESKHLDFMDGKK